jgi:hypothetical protein
MSDPERPRLPIPRYLLAGWLVLTLLAALPLSVVAGYAYGSSYSGDDAYDPAAGGFPELYANGAASYSGDDVYDLAAGALPVRAAILFAGGFSGDDAYDPAAGGLAAMPPFTIAEIQDELVDCNPSALSVAGGFSGDDPYDPAAGGNPDGDAMGLACLPATIAAP